MDNLIADHTNILSKNFQNLTEIALRKKTNYLTAEPFKNFNRKFKFYQLLKNFEKKYIRKGKTSLKDK